MKILSFLNGADGEQSSKRVFTLILMLLFVIYFFANLFYGKVLKDSIEENLFWLLVVAYGGVALEKLFTKNKQDKMTKTETETKVTKVDGGTSN